MDAKEYLERYSELKRRQRQLLEQCERERADFDSMLALCKECKSNEIHGLEAERDERLAYLMDSAKDNEVKADEIVALVESVSGAESDVLRLRYIGGCSWDQICSEMFLAWTTVWSYHNKGIKLVQERIDTQEHQVES